MAFLESQSIRRPQMTTKHASTVLSCFVKLYQSMAFHLGSALRKEGRTQMKQPIYMLIILTFSGGQAGEV